VARCACECAGVGFLSREGFFISVRNEDYVSIHYERWKELAALTSKEQDSEKLTELAKEINLVLTQKTLYLDPPLCDRSDGERS
jgi:hypothetical protein